MCEYAHALCSYFLYVYLILISYLFCLLKGASKKVNLMEWDKLWTINKKIIDPVCARHTAVLKEQCVVFTLTNGPEKPFVRILPTFANRIWLDMLMQQPLTRVRK
jgi:hypothetical protein